MAKLNVEWGNRRFETEPSLYGLFFEDINRSGDGGLYPELLRNRAFEDSLHPDDLTEEEGDLLNSTGWKFEYQKGEGLKRWEKSGEPTDIPAWYGKGAKISLLLKDTLNEKRRAALNVDFLPEGMVYNIGFCGVPVKENEVYKLFFFAKADKPIELDVSLRDGDEIIGENTIIIQGNGYIRYDMFLIPRKTTKTARFCISSKDGGNVVLGYISFMPGDTYHGHGLRKDLCEKLEDIAPAFLRFPGGCIVEGFSKSTVKRFKNMVGNVWERPTLLNLWSYNSTEGLGFHEYLQLCEDMNVDALYVCNCGMTCQARNCILLEEDEVDDMLDDALCALEYAMGDETTKWGALRGKMGHPAPFEIRYLEIGNENNGKDYEARYEKFRKAIAEKYPKLIIVANTHVEEAGLLLDIADEHFYDKPEWFAQNSHYYDGYDRKGPGIFVGEFAVVAGAIRTLYAAVSEAMFMVGMERNQDIVKLAAYAPLFENVKYAAWEPNLIAFDGLDNYAIPSYYVWRLFSQNKGRYVLNSSQECGKIYLPYLKGAPCIAGSMGMHYKNPCWKGAEVKAERFLFGSVKPCEDGSFVTAPSEDMTEAKRFNMEKTVLITMGDDMTSRDGAFEIDILAEKDVEIGIGMFATPYGEAKNSEDSPWNLFSVQPVRWTIINGVSNLHMGIGFRKYNLLEPVELNMEMGVYHHLSMESDGKMLWCKVDGKIVMEAELPNYDELQTVVLEDDKEIIVKIANIANEEKPVDISLNTQVEEDYTAGVISGKPSDKNSLENPHEVTEHWHNLKGASSSFTYMAPPCSVNVLRLKTK